MACVDIRGMFVIKKWMVLWVVVFMLSGCLKEQSIDDDTVPQLCTNDERSYCEAYQELDQFIQEAAELDIYTLEVQISLERLYYYKQNNKYLTENSINNPWLGQVIFDTHQETYLFFDESIIPIRKTIDDRLPVNSIQLNVTDILTIGGFFNLHAFEYIEYDQHIHKFSIDIENYVADMTQQFGSHFPYALRLADYKNIQYAFTNEGYLKVEYILKDPTQSFHATFKPGISKDIQFPEDVPTLVEHEHYSYYVIDHEVYLVSYLATEEHVVIPSLIDEMTVVGIIKLMIEGDYEVIRTVTFPSTIRYNEGLFDPLMGLIEVVTPSE